MNYYFISGTSSGIGKALAEELIKRKHTKVYGFSRRNELIHDQFTHQSVDLSDLEAAQNICFPELKDAKRIVLINNAGTLGDIKHLGVVSAASIITTFNVNLTAVVLLCNSFIAKYQDLAIEKTIINISSGAASSAYDGWAAYCATKAGVDMLTRAIAKEQNLKTNSINVFAIAPGVVDTYMQDSIRNTKEKDFSTIDKFHILKDEGALYKAHDVAKKLISMCEKTTSIPALISRIEL